jgi:ribonucleoside-diphosphate reductase alpha chain
MTGPKIPIAIWADETKHRQEGETHSQKCGRVAGALTDNQEHYEAFYDILSDQRFLPGGRVAAGAGSYRRVTAFNCYVMKQVPDDFLGIMEVFTEAGQTMRMGGGVGYDFSAIRPRGSRIKTLGTQASGPVTFMQIADAMCKTIASAGHRRGAQMATLRVDHPDIMEFVTAKANEHNLTQFNMSVLVTDKFMWAVEDDADFDLVFGGRVYETISARHLWDTILRNTWDWAEPGVIFIDQVNRMNNLWYVENISATNPCVSGDTPILTKEGYKSIESQVGKSIEVWNGDDWAEVTPYETGYNDIYRVTLSDGSYLDCTATHKWCVNGGFVSTENLIIGMKLDKFDMPVIKGFGPKSLHMAYSQGFYSGDGSRGYNFSFVYEPKYVCMSSLVGDFSESYGKRKVWKHGPMLDKSWVPFGLHIDYRLQWLAGLLDADGSVTRDKNGSGFQITSVDHNFLDRLRLMLTTLGVRAKVVSGNPASKRMMPDGKGGYTEYQCKETKRLLIGNYDAWHLMELGLKHHLKRLDHNGKKPQRDARQFVKVVSVEDIGYTDMTYCFTETKTSRGTFNGIVTGQCGEQPLPEYGACLLGSFNLTRYLKDDENWGFFFEFDRLVSDIPHVVRAMDNVIDETTYPLYQQRVEAKNKRRMGLGITGLANVLGVLGIEYGSKDSQLFLHQIMETITTDCYKASVELAKEKGAFPLFDADKYARGNFIKKLPDWLQEDIYYYGIRNSHLTSIAPTGTISLVANNVSSGIEPVFSHQYERTVKTVDGSFVETVEDYALREWGMECKTADQVTVDEHVDMLLAAQEWVDSAVSKTCNVGNDVTWEEFKGIYNKAFYGGAKGCTTFRPAGKRFGILNASASEDIIEEEDKEDETVIKGGACYIDQETGIRSCE